MATNQTWIRSDAAKLSYAIEKQLASGDMGNQSLNVVSFPEAASLPSTFTSDYYTPRNGAGTEKIIPSGVPFKIEGTWCWSAVDTEEGTEGLVITEAKRILVRITPSLTIAPGQRAYIIPTTGLVTNLSDGATNNYVGTFWTANADQVIFAAGALTAGDHGDILPNGTYAWIELQGAQAAPAS